MLHPGVLVQRVMTLLKAGGGGSGPITSHHLHAGTGIVAVRATQIRNSLVTLSSHLPKMVEAGEGGVRRQWGKRIKIRVDLRRKAFWGNNAGI